VITLMMMGHVGRMEEVDENVCLVRERAEKRSLGGSSRWLLK